MVIESPLDKATHVKTCLASIVLPETVVELNNPDSVIVWELESALVKVSDSCILLNEGLSVVCQVAVDAAALDRPLTVVFYSMRDYLWFARLQLMLQP